QAPAMARTAIAPDVAQAADVARDRAAQRALDGVGLLQVVRDRGRLLLGQVAGLHPALERELVADLLRGRPAYAEDVGERDLEALVRGDVDTDDAGHGLLPLTLL